MAAKMLGNGAKLYFSDDGVVLVKQTVKSEKSGRYVVDTLNDGTRPERHIDRDDDGSLARAIRAAGSGEL